MLKCEVGTERVHLECRGSITDFCSDIANIIVAMRKNLKHGPRHDFDLLFTAGFLNGAVLNISKDDMQELIEEAKKYVKVNEKKEEEDSKESTLSDIINALKSIMEHMESDDENEDE